ncbi:NAD(P)H-dependent FMN reductase [Nocardiopsis mwathae]|uniref:NAD(P)H-dependent FMN reductase n=1 Tax=Nocardiopsis mwathae TaxID=1472723 RepID=A0A7X0D8M6_9ACTN|nr:NAD(P)H-dependent oxidoreductase [Nocardiopsis mwathae]MBB6174906.1 NAD(P)H-dependent FMN reductase [Nocardiopsis mwathae]
MQGQEEPMKHARERQRLKIAVILGSTREGRHSDAVAKWFVTQAERRGDMEVDLVDLAEFAFPSAYPQEAHPEVAAFTSRLERADGFVVVTPEYNHSYPASLKQAIDYAYDEWNAKPVAFVCHGGVSQGLRAVEHLRGVFSELHTVTIRNVVSMPSPMFSEGAGSTATPGVSENPEQAAAALLEQLAWWGRVLSNARETYPYPS